VPVIFNDASFIDGGVIRCRIQTTEYLILVGDDGANDLDDVRLVLDLVAIRRNRQQRRTEADGEIVRIHHVLVTELRQAVLAQFQMQY